MDKSYNKEDEEDVMANITPISHVKFVFSTVFANVMHYVDLLAMSFVGLLASMLLANISATSSEEIWTCYNVTFCNRFRQGFLGCGREEGQGSFSE